MAKKTVPARSAIPQLNVRSSFAVKRARELARKTGSTTSKVVEDALRAYNPIDPTAAKRKWIAELRAITKRANEGQPPFDWRAVENEMYDEWGNAR